MVRALLLYKLNPDNKHLKYNIRYYLNIVAAVRGVSELVIRKDLKKIFGHNDFSQIKKWCDMKNNSSNNAPHHALSKISNYVNKYIPEMELNSDLLLTDSNEMQRRYFMNSQNNTELTPQSLGLKR